MRINVARFPLPQPLVRATILRVTSQYKPIPHPTDTNPEDLPYPSQSLQQVTKQKSRKLYNNPLEL
jgi:hypothetical protein